MICPNCGLDQSDGPACVNCRATLPRSLSASEIKTMKAGFERKEKTVPSPSTAPEPIEFNLKNLETSGKDLKTAPKDTAASNPGQSKSDTSREISKDPEAGAKDLDASIPGQRKSVTSHGIEQFQKVLVTTSSSVDGRKVLRYEGVIGSHAVVKLDGLDKFLAEIKDVSNLKGSPYGDLFKKAELLLISDLKIEAAKKEANAVVGVLIHYEFGWKNAVVIRASGTVVFIEEA